MVIGLHFVRDLPDLDSPVEMQASGSEHLPPALVTCDVLTSVRRHANSLQILLQRSPPFRLRSPSLSLRICWFPSHRCLRISVL